MTGEATAAYLADRLRDRVRVTRLASGLPVGGDLEYADEVTLGRALSGRRPSLSPAILARCAFSSPARAARSARTSRSACSPRAIDVFGVDKRLNGWTDDFRYLLQDLSGHYAAMEGGIGGVEYPPADVVVHLAAHAKVHQLVREPARALENMTMTFNVLEYCRQTRDADHLQLEPRGVRRRAPVPDRGGHRRLRLRREHVLRLEDRRRGARLLLRALLPAAVHRLPLLERLRALRQRPRRG